MKFKFCAIAVFLALLMLSSGILLKYDYAGIRTQKNANGTITNYLVEGSRILGEETNGVFTWYYYDESGVCGMRYQNVDYVFEKNILGDIVAIYNTRTKALVGTYTYDAWGNVLSQTNNDVTNFNSFRYRGYYLDKETGLYYLQSRYYDPEIGRFISPDKPENLFYTAGINGGANLYAYCGNNPISYTDPTGEFFLTAIIVGAIIGAVIASGFEAANQISKNGWNPVDWNWGDIVMAALGGAVAGGIAALPLPGFLAGMGVTGKILGYGITFAYGGAGAIAGGILTGSVRNWNDVGTAFLIGGGANVLARGATASLSWLKAGKIAGNSRVSLQGVNPILSSGSKIGTKLIRQGIHSSIQNGMRYVVYSSFISSVLSGWY